MASKMVDMMVTPEEAKKQVGAPTISTDEVERYPWGLRISLCDDDLKKLGIDKLPSVETPCTIHAIGYVCDVSEHQTEGDGPRRSLSIQITDLAVEEGVEDDDEESDPADRMYPGK